MIEHRNTLSIVDGDTQLVLADHYSRAYKTEKEDSPDLSRHRLVKKLHNAAQGLGPNSLVLDLGAGRQVLERDYRRVYGAPDFPIVTADIAQMKGHQLLERPFTLGHVTASGTALPFKEGVFSLAISNMALDFMPSSAINELHRTLKPGSSAFVNLHHPNLIPDDIDQRLLMSIYSRSAKRALRFWQYLRQNDILCRNSEEVEKMFSHSKFNIEDIILVSEAQTNPRVKPDKWWEVTLRA